jgi:hypothetical protein
MTAVPSNAPGDAPWTTTFTSARSVPIRNRAMRRATRVTAVSITRVGRPAAAYLATFLSWHRADSGFLARPLMVIQLERPLPVAGELDGIARAESPQVAVGGRGAAMPK